MKTATYSGTEKAINISFFYQCLFSTQKIIIDNVGTERAMNIGKNHFF